MKGESPLSFFKKQENRFVITLLLSVAYPIWCAGLFTAFVFVILPGFAWAQPPVLFYYWLTAAGGWLLLLAIFLPLMRDRPNDIVRHRNQRESGIDLKRVTLMGSHDLITKAEDREEKKSSEDSNSDNSIADSLVDAKYAEKAEKEALLEQRQTSSPQRELIMNSSELLSETEFTFTAAKVQVHAADDCTLQQRSNSVRSMSRLDPKTNSDNRKNLSHQNLKISSGDDLLSVSRENLKNVSLGNISSMKEEKISIANESDCEEEALPGQRTTEVYESKSSGRKFQIDIVKTQNVYECSLPSPEPLPPNTTQNRVFLYVNRGDM